MTKNKA